MSADIPMGTAGIAMVWDRMQLAVWRLREITEFCESVTPGTVWEAHDLAHEVLEIATSTPNHPRPPFGGEQ